MGSDRQSPNVLVGRTRELAEIGRALDRVAAGNLWALEVCGEPGIGKSRLLSEVCRLADERGFLVLNGRAAEFEQDMPFGVIVDALNDHVGSLGHAVFRGLDEDALDELASILPALSSLAGERTSPAAEAQRYRAHYAVRELLERLAKTQPVVLALDDIHWADAASFEALVHLLRRFRGPLLVAVAFRRTSTRSLVALEAAARAAAGSRLELAPLTPDEARALLHSELDPDARDAIYRESGGNPFYLEQLARAGANRDHSTSAQRDLGWAIPSSVIGAITYEVERLSRDRRVVLEAAAVAGESFEPGLVAAIVEQEERESLVAFDDLVAADLIHTTEVPRNFRFRHPIVRRVVYDAMPAGSRLGAHRRAADALAAGHASKAELAHHVSLSAAAGDEAAIALLVGAARDAASRAPLTAGRWLLAAARLVPGADRAGRAELLGEAGALLTSGGSFDEALESLEEALSLVPPEQIEARANLLAKRAEARRRGSRPFESRAQLTESLESLAEHDSPTGIALGLELAMNLYWHGKFGGVEAVALRLLAGAREREDLLLTALAASLGSLAMGYRGDTDRALAHLLEAQQAFRQLPDQRIAERVYLTHYISEAALRLEHAEDALSHFYRGLDAARVTGQDATTGSWWGLAVHALLLEGQLLEAASVAERAVGETEPSADDWRTILLLAAAAVPILWQGDSQRALARARDLVMGSERAHPKTILPGLARVRLGAALLMSGDPSGARDELSVLDNEDDRWLLDLDSALGWESLIRARIGVGELDAAAEAAAVAESRAAPLAQRAATVLSARSSLLVATGDAPAAAEASGEAVSIAESSENPLLLARSRMHHGVALAAAGRMEDAIADLKRAEGALSEYGAVREADAAARELRQLGARVSRRPRPDRDGGILVLSGREREVADQVAAGKTNREIAEALFLSEKTIESHLSRIYSKLDVHSRAALTAIVAREGTAAEAVDRSLGTSTL